MKEILILLLTLSALTSCSKYVLYPANIDLPKYGSYGLVKGARQGCNTAMYSRGNSFQKMFFRYEQDGELMADDEYYDAWRRGYLYCFHIVNRYAFEPIDAFIEPEHKWFWLRPESHKSKAGNPTVAYPLAQGVDLNFGGGVRLPGQGEAWWNTMFVGCKGIFQCSK